MPEGRFVLDPDTRSGAPLFLFAGGSGITPIIALLKSALLTTKRSITLLYANQDWDSVIYREEVARLASDHPDRVLVHYHLDDESGYLEPVEVRALLHHTDIAEFYICGPEPFMELIETVLQLITVEAKGRTALMDALYLALDTMRDAHNARKALLVISDGARRGGILSDSLPDFQRVVAGDIMDIPPGDEDFYAVQLNAGEVRVNELLRGSNL